MKRTVEDWFNYYVESVVESEEAAAILTLAEVIRGQERPFPAQDGPSGKQDLGQVGGSEAS